jgi:hypothetical protein
MSRFVAFVGRAIAFASAIALTSTGGSATEPTPVVVTVNGDARIRVEISEGITMPCDSSNDRRLFDGTLGPGESFRTAIAGECICIRNTRPPFRETDWTTPGLACKKRVCRGKVCRPAPDPTIRVSLP